MQIETKEFDIDVPWGHVACKVWGHQSNPMVLVVHGIMDNLCSFDRLIPFLPSTFYYVCIDLPGHGKSSPFPRFLPVHSIDNILVYKLVHQYFKRDKFILMGHSWGGQIGFLFAQLYPENVEKLIMLDTIHLYPVRTFLFKETLRDTFDTLMSIEEKLKTKTRPSYTYEEALSKLQNNRRVGQLKREAAEALLKRSCNVTIDGQYTFNLDPRVKTFLNPIHDFDYILETLDKYPVTCPVLMLLGKQSDVQQWYFKKVIKKLKTYNNVTIIQVDGHHDVHNNNPELVAPHVDKFLLNYISKL